MAAGLFENFRGDKKCEMNEAQSSVDRGHEPARVCANRAAANDRRSRVEDGKEL